MRALPYTRDRNVSTISTIYTSNAHNYSFISFIIDLNVSGTSPTECGVEIQVNHNNAGWVVAGEAYLRIDASTDIEITQRQQLSVFVPAGSTFRLSSTGGSGAVDVVSMTETIF